MAVLSIRVAAVAVALGLVAPAGRAHADEDAPPARRVLLEWQAGTPAPLAQMGTAVSVDALPWLSLSAGLGRSTKDWGDRVGTRAMVIPRARLLASDGNGIWGGLGLLYGETRIESYVGLRLYGELSAEHHWPGGFQLRLFGGVGRVVHEFGPADYGGWTIPPWRAFAGLGFGYAVWPNPDIRPGPGSVAGRWYGWQILALGLLGASPYVFTETSRGAIVDERRELTRKEMRVAYFVTGPVVHYGHHRYGRMAASLGLRAGLGFLGYWYGSGVHMSDNTVDNFANGASIVFGVVATLIDAFALGWEAPAPPP